MPSCCYGFLNDSLLQPGQDGLQESFADVSHESRDDYMKPKLAEHELTTDTAKLKVVISDQQLGDIALLIALDEEKERECRAESA